MICRSRCPVVFVWPLVLILGACGEGEAPRVAEVERAGFTATSAGVRLSTLPGAFEVVVNDDERLELTVPALQGPSTIFITLGALEAGGLNIVERVKEELARFDARPEGQSFGQTKLVAPMGLTYMVRGRYRQDDVTFEELRALLVHPWGNRLLRLVYRYPAADDSSERGRQLMELLGEMEALEPLRPPP